MKPVTLLWLPRSMRIYLSKRERRHNSVASRDREEPPLIHRSSLPPRYVKSRNVLSVKIKLGIFQIDYLLKD